ncbi:hypothetical protein GCM10027610_040850 [Dactylosporangium cerinum]
MQGERLRAMDEGGAVVAELPWYQPRLLSARAIAWNGGRSVCVRDVYLIAGQQVTVTVNPADVACLFASGRADSSTWVQPRDLASTRTSGGRMRHTAVWTGWHGLVLRGLPPHTAGAVLRRSAALPAGAAASGPGGAEMGEQDLDSGDGMPRA